MDQYKVCYIDNNIRGTGITQSLYVYLINLYVYSDNLKISDVVYQKRNCQILSGQHYPLHACLMAYFESLSLALLWNIANSKSCFSHKG